MKVKDYEQLRTQPYFLNKKIKVCYNCYFDLLKTNELGGNDEMLLKLKHSSLKGVQGLRNEGMKTKAKVVTIL
jgi:hypothetical protein